MSVETLSVPIAGAGPESSNGVTPQEWIDRNTQTPDDLRAVIDQLTAWTLPAEPWLRAELVPAPFRVSPGDLTWPWNRAGGNLLDGGHAEAATEVWSAHYLAALSLQRHLHLRFYKGTPLCNLGLAHFRAGDRGEAAKCWLLGLVEDALRQPETSLDGTNASNLKQEGVTEAALEGLAATAAERFVAAEILPAVPETVLDLWLRPAAEAPSEECFHGLNKLFKDLDRAYPKLPDTANARTLLRECWASLDTRRAGVSG